MKKKAVRKVARKTATKATKQASGLAQFFHSKNRPVHGMLVGSGMLLLKGAMLLVGVVGVVVFLVSLAAYLSNMKKKA